MISDRLSQNARRFGDDIALVERDPAHSKRVEITWKTFDDNANRMAQALIDRGIRKGDRVVLLMTNCIEWLPIYFGILRTGALAVPLNFRFVAKTIQRCVETAEASAIIFGQEFIERIDSIKNDLDRHVKAYYFAGPRESTPGYAAFYEDILTAYPPENPAVALSLADDAALYFTSGTTGFPKGALLTHDNLEFACEVEKRHHGQTRDDNFLCIPPLYHTGAKMHWFGNFVVGARAVILKGIKPVWIMEAISEERVTVVWLLVPWAQDILLAIENGDIQLADYRLDQWRLMHIGAQPVPPSLIREWKKIFPGHQYDTNYGLTEATGPGCVHLGLENTHKVGAIGRPGYRWETAVVDDCQAAVEQGSPGELMVRGPGVMKEYYRNPEATAEAFHDGWLLTGDIVHEDEDGFIWIVDRKKDVIITGGENIYPVEIEDFLQSYAKIQDVAVIGLPDPRLGEISAAIIKAKPGQIIDEAEILAFCQELPRYKRPRRVIFGDVPRNPTGKIEKPALRKQYAGA